MTGAWIYTVIAHPDDAGELPVAVATLVRDGDTVKARARLVKRPCSHQPHVFTKGRDRQDAKSS